MTQPRRVHRRVFLALSVGVPVLFLAGLVVRLPLAPAERVSDRISLLLPNGAEVVADSRELWGDAVDSPDSLIYWSADGTSLSALMGTLDTARHSGLHVPESAQSGYLILYSTVRRKTLAKAPVPKEMP